MSGEKPLKPLEEITDEEFQATLRALGGPSLGANPDHAPVPHHEDDSYTPVSRSEVRRNRREVWGPTRRQKVMERVVRIVSPTK